MYRCLAYGLNPGWSALQNKTGSRASLRIQARFGSTKKQIRVRNNKIFRLVFYTFYRYCNLSMDYLQGGLWYLVLILKKYWCRYGINNILFLIKVVPITVPEAWWLDRPDCRTCWGWRRCFGSWRPAAWTAGPSPGGCTCPCWTRQ